VGCPPLWEIRRSSSCRYGSNPLALELPVLLELACPPPTRPIYIFPRLSRRLSFLFPFRAGLLSFLPLIVFPYSFPFRTSKKFPSAQSYPPFFINNRPWVPNAPFAPAMRGTFLPFRRNLPFPSFISPVPSLPPSSDYSEFWSDPLMSCIICPLFQHRPSLPPTSSHPRCKLTFKP